MDRLSIYRIALFCCVSSFLRSTTKADLHHNELEETDIFGQKRFRPPQSRDLSNMLLDKVRNRVYVGAVNFIYELDADDVTIKKAEIHWAPEPFPLRTCLRFKGDSARCQNSIRVLHAVNDTFIYACGTMAFSPTCTYIDKRDFKRISGREERGKWRAPQDPMSTTVSTMIDDCLFTATNLASQTKNGVIAKSVGDGTSLRTNENDNFCLSDPQFVSAFRVPEENGDQKIFVLLKENAEEIPSEILTQYEENSYSVVYSRLGSICANDRGGNMWILKDKFATFTKMRIACPVPTNRGKNRRVMPFFYDEIENSFILPNPNDPSNPTIYTIFTTPDGAFEATATCVYEMNDVRRYLKTNQYWAKPNGKPSKLSTASYDGPTETAPGECVPDTSVLSTERLKFGDEHPLKYGIIKPKEGYAIYQDAGKAFKHIVVDRIKQKEKLGSEIFEREYDIVHYISDTGDIKRVVFYAENRSRFWEIPSRNVFNNVDIKEKILTVRLSNGYLYFGSNASVTQIPVAFCSAYTTCAECSSVNDPYCIWDEKIESCEIVDFNRPTKRSFLFYEKMNTTTMCTGSDINADKKSSEQNDAIHVITDEEIEALSLENEELKQINLKQNETIHHISKRNSFLTTKLTESMHELHGLAQNYSHATTLLIQYNQRRKLVLQLYRNTVYSLHACQHKEKTRELAEKEARDSTGLLKKRKIPDASPVECKKQETENTRENREGTETERCIDEEEVQRMKTSLRKNMKSIERQSKSDKQNLAVCLASSKTLKAKIRDFEETEQNSSKLREVIKKLGKENDELTTSIAASGCGRSEWFTHKSTGKKYLLTRESSGHARAQRFCKKINARLAVIKTNEEASYVHDIVTQFSGRKRFWIGLEKHGNGTMVWSDGSRFNPVTSHRFSKSQNSKLSNGVTYCVETTQHESLWQLIPCNKSRRIICVEDYYHADVQR